jgi:hypothetical protein
MARAIFHTARGQNCFCRLFHFPVSAGGGQSVGNLITAPPRNCNSEQETYPQNAAQRLHFLSLFVCCGLN